MANKSVVVVNEKLDRGQQANVAFVLGLTVGRLLPEETFGGDVMDGDGATHRYLTRIGHTVRKANPNKLATLRNAFATTPEVVVVDYTKDAVPPVYEEYEAGLRSHSGDAIVYYGIAVYGPEELVISKTKNLSILSGE